MNEKNNLKCKKYEDIDTYPSHALTAEQMKSCGYTKLVDSHENIFTYLNEDGSKTVYIFSAPLEDKKLCIRQDKNWFAGKGKYFDVKLPNVLSHESGISIGGFIDIFPVDNKEYSAKLEEKTNIFGQKKECVAYKDFYNDGVSLNCYATGFGLNCEIVIPEYTGKNIYSFKIRQPENFYVEEESDYVVFRDEGDIKSMIYTSLAVDSKGIWNYNNKINLAFEGSGLCNVHFTIDDEFLRDSKTEYPVVINQSINAYKHKQPDTSVYSGTDDSVRHYLSPYMLLGDSTVKGEGWALIRFELLDNIDISADSVISAEYNFVNLFDSKDDVTVGAFAITSDWCSVNTRWKSRPAFDEIPVKTTRIKDSGAYSIDITRLFREIIKGKGQYESPYSVRNSFFIKSNTKKSNLILASGDSGIFSPYLKIVTGTDVK